MTFRELAVSLKREFGDSTLVAGYFAKAIIAEQEGNTEKAEEMLEKACKAEK